MKFQFVFDICVIQLLNAYFLYTQFGRFFFTPCQLRTFSAVKLYVPSVIDE